MTAKQVAELSGKTIWQIYAIAKELKRIPTVEEATAWKAKPRGRPRKRFE
jgi:hypothetical protein